MNESINHNHHHLNQLIFVIIVFNSIELIQSDSSSLIFKKIFFWIIFIFHN
jgi:hypothetical protein